MHYMTPNLWAYIRGKGHKLTWLADASGVSRAQLYRIKNGERAITQDVAVRISDALGVPFDAFFMPVASTKSSDNRSIEIDVDSERAVA
jgi:transcriptional regulator with XRE-family HTH domain